MQFVSLPKAAAKRQCFILEALQERPSGVATLDFVCKPLTIHLNDKVNDPSAFAGEYVGLLGNDLYALRLEPSSSGRLGGFARHFVLL